jgi:hypothetical protein
MLRLVAAGGGVAGSRRALLHLHPTPVACIAVRRYQRNDHDFVHWCTGW